MELAIEYLPVAALRKNPQNTRRHTDYDISQIAKSITKYGFVSPCGIAGTDNTVYVGNGRLEAATQLGMETVPCVRLDHLNKTQLREFAILDNKIAELSEWDWPTLELELDELDLSDFDIDFGMGANGEIGDDFFTDAPPKQPKEEEYNVRTVGSGLRRESISCGMRTILPVDCAARFRGGNQ